MFFADNFYFFNVFVKKIDAKTDLLSFADQKIKQKRYKESINNGRWEQNILNTNIIFSFLLTQKLKKKKLAPT